MYISHPKYIKYLLMRSQYMPLALCLFLSFFVVSHSLLAKNIPIKKTEKSFKINGLDKDKHAEMSGLKMLASNEFLSLNQEEAASFKKEASSNSKTTLSVNSYKSDEEILGTMEVSTQNFAIHPVTFETGSFWLGLFYGSFLMLIVLNLVCFFLFGEKAFLYFSGACAAVTLLLSGSDGTLATFLNTGAAILPFFSAAALMLFAFFSFSFGCYYLKLDRPFPKLKLVSFALLAISISIIVGASFVNESKLLAIASVASVAVICLYFVMGVLYFSRNNYAKFYVIATAIPTLFIIDFFVIGELGLTFLSTESVHIKTAVLIQTLVMTYAIMYRMRAIKEENELRVTEMRIFMKRQELMNRENVKQMVQEVYLENLIMQYDLDGLEIKLLQYISEGKENVKIARKLKISEKEVEEHTNDLYSKLEIREQIKEDHRMLESQPDYIYN